jgi:hypothetical protein
LAVEALAEKVDGLVANLFADGLGGAVQAQLTGVPSSGGHVATHTIPGG